MFPLLILAFLVVPVVEIYVIIKVGQWIGPWPTVALLLIDGFLGAWLFKREGRRTWTAFRTALSDGRFPGREVADGALVLVGGTLLLSPGFVTDVVGALLLLPFTRIGARRLLQRFLKGRFGILEVLGDPGVGSPPRARRAPRPPRGGEVIEGETVRRDDPPR